MLSGRIVFVAKRHLLNFRKFKSLFVEEFIVLLHVSILIVDYSRHYCAYNLRLLMRLNKKMINVVDSIVRNV